ncbi:acyltransferase family protein [Rhodoferax sp. WC2427]|uniref:acyltransferase family protein n=1 Tax=Rhodoferax sp. WC2427 TaxID=3234144 RepID=UPI0034657824
MSDKNQRLITLDAMRGIAAILVVIFHLRNVGFSQAKSAYLAVDLFFLLSGFVIAKTYDPRLRAGLELWRFAILRYIRLYPLFAVGLFIALAHRLWQISLGRPDAMTSTDVWLSLATEAFMLPSIPGMDLYMLNLPGWSLFFEIAVNLIYAAFLFKAPVKVLVAIAALTGTALVWLTVSGDGINHGPRWEGLWFGFIRAGFAFTVGAILARVHNSPPRESRIALIPMVVLIALLCVPPKGYLFGAAYELTVVVILAPILVWVGATLNPPRSFFRASEAMGDLSYAIYVIHYPLIFICAWAAEEAGIDRIIWMPAFLVVALSLAWSLHRFFDVPIRIWLNDIVRRKYAHTKQGQPTIVGTK